MNIASSNVPALLHRSEWYLAEGQSREAVDDLMRAYNEDTTNLSVLEDLVFAYIKIGDPERVSFYAAKEIEILKNSYGEDQEDLSVLEKLVFAYAKVGDLKNADMFANKIVNNMPGKEDRVRQIAYRWNNQELPVESSIIFKALTNSDPTNAKDALAYAISVCQADGAVTATRLFDELLDTDEAGAVAAWDSLVVPSRLYKYDAVATCWREVVARFKNLPS